MHPTTRLLVRPSLHPHSLRILRTFTAISFRRTGGPTTGPSNDLHKSSVDEEKPMPEHPKNDSSFANKVESKIGQSSDVSTNKGDPANVADKAEKIMPGESSMDPDPQQNKTFGGKK